MPFAGGQGGPTLAQLTLFQPGRTDYAHPIAACPPEFENLMASLDDKAWWGWPKLPFLPVRIKHQARKGTGVNL